MDPEFSSTCWFKPALCPSLFVITRQKRVFSATLMGPGVPTITMGPKIFCVCQHDSASAGQTSGLELLWQQKRGGRCWFIGGSGWYKRKCYCRRHRRLLIGIRLQLAGVQLGLNTTCLGEGSKISRNGWKMLPVKERSLIASLIFVPSTLQVAGPKTSGLNVVEKTKAAVNTAKVIGALNKISSILKVATSLSPGSHGNCMCHLVEVDHF